MANALAYIDRATIMGYTKRRKKDVCISQCQQALPSKPGLEGGGIKSQSVIKLQQGCIECRKSAENFVIYFELRHSCGETFRTEFVTCFSFLTIDISNMVSTHIDIYGFCSTVFKFFVVFLFEYFVNLQALMPKLT